MKVAILSVISNVSLVLAKGVVGIMTASVSVLSEAIHSAMDLVAALIALFAVKQADKPADDRHQYGHGKIENVSGTIEALLIFLAAIWIIIEAAEKIKHGVTEIDVGLGLIVMAISSLVNTLVSIQLMKVAKKTESVALEADAMHLRTDVYTSMGVFIGLILVKITGWQIIDPIMAILVALLIIKAAFSLTREAFLPLLDTNLPIEEENAIKEIIFKHKNAYIEFHKLRTRKAGAERHIDLHLVVPKERPISQVHDLCDLITYDIKQQFPKAHVLIHSEPCDDTCKQCTDCHHLGE